MKIARGAAMMTDTTVEIEFIKACSNVVINTELNRLMQKNLEQVPPAGFDEADLEQARRYQQTFPKGEDLLRLPGGRGGGPPDARGTAGQGRRAHPPGGDAAGPGAPGLCVLGRPSALMTFRCAI